MPTVEDLGRKLKAKYPGSYDHMPDVEAGRKLKAKYPGSYDHYADINAPIEGTTERLKKDASIGWREGKADVAHTISNVAGAVPIPAARRFGKSAQEYADQNTPTPQEVAGHKGVIDQVVRGAAQVPSQIFKYLPASAARKYAPVAGGIISAAGAMDRGPAATLRAGVEGAVSWYGIEKAGKIKSTIPRMAASAALQAVPVAIESGGDARSTTAAAITGLAFGIPAAHEHLTPSKAREAVKGGMDRAIALQEDIHSTFAPHKLRTLPEKTTDKRGVDSVKRVADPTAARVRELLIQGKAEVDRRKQIAAFGMRGAREGLLKKGFVGKNQAEFYRAVESGTTTGDTKVDDFGKLMIKVVNDNARQVEAESGTRKIVNPDTGKEEESPRLKLTYYANYLARIFEDPKKTQEYMMARFDRNAERGGGAGVTSGRRPMGGSGNRMKGRTLTTDGDLVFDTIADALEIGLKLKHDNPVDAQLDAISEIQRLAMSRRLVKRLRPETNKAGEVINPGGYNILRRVSIKRGSPPKDYVFSNDPAFDIYARNKKTGKRELVAKWAMPKSVGAIFNNELSEGLEKKAWFKTVKSFGVPMLQARYGISAWHAGKSAFESSLSQVTLGIEKIIHGLRTGDASMVGRGALDLPKSVAAPISKLLPGYDLRRAMRDPKNANPEELEMAQNYVMAGGRADVDPVYLNGAWDKMRVAFKDGSALLGFFRVPYGVVEKLAMPIMRHYVPLQKMGAFSDMARFELEKLGDYASVDERRSAFQRAYESVENRFGQLTYDNLGYSKISKDLAQIGLAAASYRIGTFREILGGGKDWGKAVKSLSKGERAEFTHRMAYTVAMPMVVGFLGALTNKTLTGEWPQDIRDYLFPRDGHKDEAGRPNRISYPSYMNDVYSATTDFPSYLYNMTHPVVQTMFEIGRDRDFNGVEIYNRHDNFVQQMGEYMQHYLGQYTPFSVSQEGRLQNMPDVPGWEKAGTFLGLKEAPASARKGAAENYASKVLLASGDRATITEEQDKERRVIREIKSDMRFGLDPTPKINAAIADGTLAPQSVKRAEKTINFSPLYNDMRHLDLEDAIEVFKLATPAEKIDLLRRTPGKRSIIEDKILNQAKSIKSGSKSAKDTRKIAAEAVEIMELARRVNGNGN